MGISGLVGAGAQAGLDQLLERQMVEQQMAMRLKALEAEERNRQESLRLQEKAIAQRDAESVRETESRERDRRDTANTRGVSLMLQERGLMDEEAARNAPRPIKLRNVTKRGPKGEPINAMVPEDQEVEEYREPRAATGGAPDQEWVIRDGQPTPIPKGTARPGDMPYEKGSASGSKRDDMDSRIQEYTRSKSDEALATVNELLGGADGKSGKVSGSTAGIMGMTGYLPGTPARSMQAVLDQLKGQIAFKELAAMRAASPTGGALGQVSERELALLSSTLGGLDPLQDPAALRGQLEKVRDSLQRMQTSLPVGANRVPGGVQAEGAQAPMTKPIPGIPGAIAASADGGKTWIRVQ